MFVDLVHLFLSAFEKTILFKNVYAAIFCSKILVKYLEAISVFLGISTLEVSFRREQFIGKFAEVHIYYSKAELFFTIHIIAF